MEAMLFAITDEYCQPVCEPMFLTFEDIYWIKKVFVCEVQYGQIILL